MLVSAGGQSGHRTSEGIRTMSTSTQSRTAPAKAQATMLPREAKAQYEGALAQAVKAFGQSREAKLAIGQAVATMDLTAVAAYGDDAVADRAQAMADHLYQAFGDDAPSRSSIAYWRRWWTVVDLMTRNRIGTKAQRDSLREVVARRLPARLTEAEQVAILRKAVKAANGAGLTEAHVIGAMPKAKAKASTKASTKAKADTKAKAEGEQVDDGAGHTPATVLQQLAILTAWAQATTVGRSEAKAIRAQVDALAQAIHTN